MGIACNWRENRAYDEIVGLVPEIRSYKETTIEHVRIIAERRGARNLVEYRKMLEASADEVAFLRVNLTLKGTHFFRGDDWEFFADRCLSTYAGADRVDVWCAGCSSGEEAYATVMALLDHVPANRIDVLATDYNDELLAKCERASYGNNHLHEIPERYRRHVIEGEGRFGIKDELRRVVRTANVNLLAEEFPGPFDIIVCRNVIKFFSYDKMAEVKRKLAASLNAGGFLFVSTDDNHMGLELIDDPAALGLEQLDGRGIYRKLVKRP